MSNTVQGNRETLTAFPGCAVNPAPIEIVPVTSSKSEYSLRFEVVVGVEETTPTESVKTAMQYANKIIEKVSSDRTLNGTVSRTEVVRITPELARQPQYSRCWTQILFECKEVRE